MLRQYELLEKVASYDPGLNETLLNKAYVFSMKVHGLQMRESGELFFSHPVEVAGILADFRFDYITIIAALLHDTVEDTVATLEDIRQAFGEKVAHLVDGVTKISQLELISESGKTEKNEEKKSRQAENFRKLVLAMAQDIRVLFVKLADRLHNMRTLKYIKDPERRRRIAQETLDIYAPLASRVGVQQIREPLEDLSFQELYSDVYQALTDKLKFLRAEASSVEDVVQELQDILSEAGIPAKISGRIKTPYSIWKKMEMRNAPFEELCDIIAFRVIVPTWLDCYKALGLFHKFYRMVPGHFRDYISTPKMNGYQSLHTTVLNPKYHRTEIQIRTNEMDLAAEYGIAAHWQYKQGVDSHEGKKYAWVRDLLKSLQQAQNPEEFFENTKIEFFQDQVFCFTASGKLLSLPKNATVIDFAYALSPETGNHLFSAKINGKPASLFSLLQHGDQIEITTTPQQNVEAKWLKWASTGTAKACIQQIVRAEKTSSLS